MNRTKLIKIQTAAKEIRLGIQHSIAEPPSSTSSGSDSCILLGPFIIFALGFFIPAELGELWKERKQQTLHQLLIPLPFIQFVYKINVVTKPQITQIDSRRYTFCTIHRRGWQTHGQTRLCLQDSLVRESKNLCAVLLGETSENLKNA